MLNVARLEAFVLRCPIDTPVQTSFGIMRDRPAVFARVTDTEGAQGWGEVWCNFPTVGAEHRARLLDSVFAPLLVGSRHASPAAAFQELSARTEVLAIQSAEPGPIAQCIAGLDIALWDLHARRLGQPLWRLLGGVSPEVPVYASGLNPTEPERLAAAQQAQGFRAFKLKVGFGRDRDLGNLRTLREAVGDSDLMVDANQAWDLEAAAGHAAAFAPFGLRWLEEPLRATRPWSEWQALSARVPMPLAAGENLASVEAFGQALDARCLGVLQPDLAKWGGSRRFLPAAPPPLGRRLAHYTPHTAAAAGPRWERGLGAGRGGSGRQGRLLWWICAPPLGGNRRAGGAL